MLLLPLNYTVSHGFLTQYLGTQLALMKREIEEITKKSKTQEK